MPPTRSDRRLLLLTGSFLVIAAVLFGGVLWVATTRDNTPKGAFFIGLEQPLKSHIHEGSPLYFSNPGAGDGFWLDIEERRLVALALDRPGTKDCPVKWKDQRDAFIDCNDDELQNTDLDHYVVTIGSRNDSPKDSVYVDLHKIVRSTGGSAN